MKLTIDLSKICKNTIDIEFSSNIRTYSIKLNFAYKEALLYFVNLSFDLFKLISGHKYTENIRISRLVFSPLMTIVEYQNSEEIDPITGLIKKYNYYNYISKNDLLLREFQYNIIDYLYHVIENDNELIIDDLVRCFPNFKEQKHKSNRIVKLLKNIKKKFV